MEQEQIGRYSPDADCLRKQLVDVRRPGVGSADASRFDIGRATNVYGINKNKRTQCTEFVQGRVFSRAGA